MRWEVLDYLANLEIDAGNLDRASAYSDEGYEIAAEAGLEMELLKPKAIVAALRGETDAARSDAKEGLRISELWGNNLMAIHYRTCLGFLELSVGRHEGAWEVLRPLPSIVDGMDGGESAMFPFAHDAVEALLALGRMDEAQGLTDWLEAKERAFGHATLSATANRCRGLLAAAGADLAAAFGPLQEALDEYRTEDRPFAVARTLLVLGTVHRRAKQKAAARSSLEEALAIFERLSAPLWAEKARAELARIGGRPPAPGDLTPTEQRIADLVAEGKTNREVADALFLSVKTVEGNLSRIYAKLGVRSRTELTRHVVGEDRAEP